MKTKFIKFCRYGNLDNIKQLINSNVINIHADNEDGFIWACENGHKHIVEYLINLYKNDNKYAIVNIHANDECGFRWACHSGHKHIVEYLINLYKHDNKYAIINIHADNEDGFSWACKNGHKHIVEYLLSVGCYLHGYNNSKILL